MFSLLCCWVDTVSCAKHGIGGVAEKIRDVCVFVRGLELDGKCDDDDVCVWVGVGVRGGGGGWSKNNTTDINFNTVKQK